MAEIQAQALVMDVNNDGEVEIVAGRATCVATKWGIKTLLSNVLC